MSEVPFTQVELLPMQCLYLIERCFFIVEIHTLEFGTVKLFRAEFSIFEYVFAVLFEVFSFCRYVFLKIDSCSSSA